MSQRTGMYQEKRNAERQRCVHPSALHKVLLWAKIHRETYLQKMFITTTSYCKLCFVPKYQLPRVSLVAQMVKNLPARQDTQVWSLGGEDPLEKEIPTHSSILVWRIQWTEEPGGLRSMASQIVRHDWVTSTTITISSLFCKRITPLFFARTLWGWSLMVFHWL